MNDKFYELRLPIETQVGKWVVYTWFTFGGEPYGYLHNNSKLYESWFIANSPTNGLFESRLDALIETKSYYRKYKEIFPHGKELSNELNVKFALTRQSQAIESQPMVFK